MAELAPDLVPTDATKRDKFVWGLKLMIAHDIEVIIGSETSMYAQVVDIALR